MLCLCRWPAAERLETVGLILEPLRIEHAEEMVLVLGDRRLYAYTGGEPPDLDRLRARFARQIVGRSSDGEHGWLNWIVRVRSTWEAAGVVQATLSDEDRHVEAEIAWIVGVAQQGNGYATEAAVAMVGWLTRHGVAMLVAHIHPGHAASIGVARRLGLSPTEVSVDGETRWIGPATCHRPAATLSRHRVRLFRALGAECETAEVLVAASKRTPRGHTVIPTGTRVPGVWRWRRRRLRRRRA